MMPDTTQALLACDVLIAEHREMEGFLDTLEGLLATVSNHPEQKWLSETQMILAKISAHINTHFTCEEQGLFPVLEKYHPMVLMEAEHEELVALRDQTLTHFEQKAFTDLKETGMLLSKELRDHIAREDGGIFPAAERDMDDSDKQIAIEKMSAIREAAKTTPTPAISRPDRYFKAFEVPAEQAFARPVNVQKLLESAGTTVKELAIKGGEALAEHWSPHPVVLYCLSGKARFEANGEQQALKPGNGLYFSPQLKHALFAETDSRFLLVFLPGK